MTINPSPWDLRRQAYSSNSLARAYQLDEKAQILEDQMFNDPELRKLQEKHRKTRRVVTTSAGMVWL